jgi:tektin-3
LVEEVGEIFESIDQLKAKLRESENGLQQLLRMKTALEQDLSIKSNSLHIDREKCLSLHSQFPMSPRVSSF